MSDATWLEAVANHRCSEKRSLVGVSRGHGETTFDTVLQAAERGATYVTPR
jgi:hypothetical protein